MARKTHRGRHSRGRFGFLYVVLSFLLIVAALVVGSVVFFRAHSITVVGNHRYSSEEIITASQVKLEENLFRIHRGNTAQRILDALPYIRDVNVRRDLPDELVITVTETHAVAGISLSNGCFLLDARGKVVEQVSSLPESLPQVTALEALSPVIGQRLETEPSHQARLNGLTGLLTALEERGMLEYLLYVDLSSASDLLFGYTDRFTVQIPLLCDHDYKLGALDYVVNALEANETGLIDLTRSDETHFIPQ